MLLLLLLLLDELDDGSDSSSIRCSRLGVMRDVGSCGGDGEGEGGGGGGVGEQVSLSSAITDKRGLRTLVCPSLFV